MLYADFLDAIGRSGLSVRAFAELVGMNPNSISNYARTGELPTHLALIAVLVAGVSELGETIAASCRRSSLRPRSRAAARVGAGSAVIAKAIWTSKHDVPSEHNIVVVLARSETVRWMN